MLAAVGLPALIIEPPVSSHSLGKDAPRGAIIRYYFGRCHIVTARQREATLS